MIPNTLIEAAQAVRTGAITPTQLTEHALQQIETTRDLNAIAFVDAERAVREADVLTREAQAGQFRGPLHGVPITIKDLYNVQGMPTKAGTRAPLPVIAPDEAIAVQRLRAAGTLILAKTNMVEIALGIHGENAWTGDVKNPHNPLHQTGGSSSGSGASLAAGVAWGSLGSDTAGSIRIPAALCGIVGFKPSFGVVPLDGALPLCWSCDHAGPLARTVADAAMMFEVLRTPTPLPNGEGLGAGAKPLTHGLSNGHLPLSQGGTSPWEERSFAIPRAYIDGALTREMRIAFDDLIVRIKASGAIICEVTLDVGDFMASFMPLRAESASVHRHALETQPDGFQPAVRDALMQGYIYSALQYIDALRKQREMRAAIHRALDGTDALLLPTTQGAAPLRGQVEVELESGTTNTRLAVLHFTGPFAFAGVHAEPFLRFHVSVGLA